MLTQRVVSVYGRPYGGAYGASGWHTHHHRFVLFKLSVLSADLTIFAKLRIKSEKADALAIGFDLAPSQQFIKVN